jgi:ABC-type lipoprotein release transport system permease subunit
MRAIGMKARRVTVIFLGRAALVGLAGALAGCLLGFAAGLLGAGFLHSDAAAAPIQALLTGLGVPVVWVLLAAPVLSALASWLPAQHAGQMDPALILRRD